MDYRKIYKSCLEEGIISGSLTRFERNQMFRFLGPWDQAAWIWERYYNSSALKQYRVLIANRYLEDNPDIDIKRDLDFDPHPIDLDEPIDWTIDKSERVCLKCATGSYRANSTRIGYALLVPVDYVFKTFIFETEVGEGILKKINKDYEKYYKIVSENPDPTWDLLSKKDYMSETLKVISKKAWEMQAKQWKKEGKAMARRDKQRAKQAAKEKAINSIKSDFGVE